VAAITDEERLRKLLGESIPDGGAASDTLFSDDEITDLLGRHSTVEASLGEAWEMKAAALADLVTTVEGSSQRKLSDLHDHALAQAKYYRGDLGGLGRTRIGTITRTRRSNNYT
jgi:hypothetical protein